MYVSSAAVEVVCCATLQALWLSSATLHACSVLVHTFIVLLFAGQCLQSSCDLVMLSVPGGCNVQLLPLDVTAAITIEGSGLAGDVTCEAHMHNLCCW